MPAVLKPIAFLDLDGPILDVSARHHRVYADITASLGGSPIDLEAFWSAKRHKKSDGEILSRSGLTTDTTAYQPLKMAAIESPAYIAHDRLQPHVRETLVQIAVRYRLVLVTLRQSRSVLMDQLAALGIAGIFTGILSSPAGNRSGWETKCALVRDSGIPSGPRGFFAGDTETDILAGRTLDVATVAVCNGIRDEKFLRSLSPDWNISSLADLPSSTSLLR